MNKKGFTLIELLAVIVILAVLALITAPIVIGIIANSRESSDKLSGTNYISAVNTAIAKVSMNEMIENGYYEINNDGNVCLGHLENNKCSGEKLKITSKGKKPVKGNMIIEDGVVSRATVIYDNFTVELAYDGSTEYFPFAKEYKLGEKVMLEITGIGNIEFYVVDEKQDRVTFLPGLTPTQMGIDHLDWVSSSDCSKLSSNAYTGLDCVAVGPYTMLKASYSLRLPTDKFLPIKNYVYENNEVIKDKLSYKKYEIDNDVVKITTSSGKELSETTRATYFRFLTAEEILKIGSTYNLNLSHNNLQKRLNKNLDKINKLFISMSLINTRVKDITELFNVLNMDNNWKTTAIFATFIFGTLNLDNDLKEIALPDFFGKDGEIWWTLSTTKFWNDINVIIQVQIDKNNKPHLFFKDRIEAYSSDGYKPVVTVSKETLRKALK